MMMIADVFGVYIELYSSFEILACGELNTD